ncbi:hypothetical protein F4780DRAFT_776423 [Xylariomycetidae sp. FL0641]|nr:hypothetical protein F4780DRAFT_776423 [Xylariomycetidae sp. FL0641]
MPSLQCIPAYREYQQLQKRPIWLGEWPKDSQGRYVLARGEMFCRKRYESIEALETHLGKYGRKRVVISYYGAMMQHKRRITIPYNGDPSSFHFTMRPDLLPQIEEQQGHPEAASGEGNSNENSSGYAAGPSTDKAPSELRAGSGNDPSGNDIGGSQDGRPNHVWCLDGDEEVREFEFHDTRLGWFMRGPHYGGERPHTLAELRRYQRQRRSTFNEAMATLEDNELGHLAQLQTLSEQEGETADSSAEWRALIAAVRQLGFDEQRHLEEYDKKRNEKKEHAKKEQVEA